MPRIPHEMFLPRTLTKTDAPPVSVMSTGLGRPLQSFRSLASKLVHTVLTKAFRNRWLPQRVREVASAEDSFASMRRPSKVADAPGVAGNSALSDEPAQAESFQRKLRIAVGIATVGRPVVLNQALRHLMGQTRVADRTIVCVASPDDAGNVEALMGKGVEIIIGSRGTTRQRNAILDHVHDCDLIVFFDDDFVPERSYLQEAESLFMSRREIAISTGAVLADGICGAGLEFMDAIAILKEARLSPSSNRRTRYVYNGYGCNMVARLRPIRDHRIRFDVDLPLYGWLEDVDFSRQLAAFGEIVLSEATQGVHLGVKQGRQSGQRLGYSQIANPVFLIRKQTMNRGRALSQMARNTCMNLAKSVRPESYVDRRGRLLGNLRGFVDLLCWRLHPRRALDI